MARSGEQLTGIYGSRAVYGLDEPWYAGRAMISGPPGERDASEIDDEPTNEQQGSAAAAPALESEQGAMAYAVHTTTCSYLLDAQGICRWIVATRGAVPPHVNRCVGAQFVACLDLATPGGLVGDLRPGAMALFVTNREPGRMVLLRTAPIESVDGAGAATGGSGAPPAFGDHALQAGSQYGKRGGVPVTGPRPEPVAVQSLGAEQTVTVATTAYGASGEAKPPKPRGAG